MFSDLKRTYIGCRYQSEPESVLWGSSAFVNALALRDTIQLCGNSKGFRDESAKQSLGGMEFSYLHRDEWSLTSFSPPTSNTCRTLD